MANVSDGRPGSNFKYSLDFEPKNDVTSTIYAQVAKME